MSGEGAGRAGASAGGAALGARPRICRYASEDGEGVGVVDAWSAQESRWSSVATRARRSPSRSSRWIGPDLTLLGVGLGNDMTARDIEAENPLYLPQAKVWDGSCALGPWVVAWTDGDDLADVALGLEIQRRGEAAFAGAIDFAAMRRSPTELIALLGRETSFQDGVVLLTGTGIVPPEDINLEVGDEVRISGTGLGELRNPVVVGARWRRHAALAPD